MLTRDHMESVCDQYLAAVSSRDADRVMALFSDQPTVEDPVGSPVRNGREAVREFYSHISGTVRLERIGPACVVGKKAAFLFRLDIERDGERRVYASIDVFTFDDDGRVAAMVAYPDRDADPGGS